MYVYASPVGRDKRKEYAIKSKPVAQCCKYDPDCPWQDPCPFHEKGKRYVHPARWRDMDPESEGESDSGNPFIAHRALREDEGDVLTRGIVPRPGYDPQKTLSQHITSGSRAKKKARFISASRSIKVAGAWAGNQKKVATFELGSGVKAYNFTGMVPPVKLGVTALSAARASQEVCIDGSIPPQNILNISTVHEVEPDVYDEHRDKATFEGLEITHRFKTRQKSGDSVKCYILTKD